MPMAGVLVAPVKFMLLGGGLRKCWVNKGSYNGHKRRSVQARGNWLAGVVLGHMFHRALTDAATCLPVLLMCF